VTPARTSRLADDAAVGRESVERTALYERVDAGVAARFLVAYDRERDRRPGVSIGGG